MRPKIVGLGTVGRVCPSIVKFSCALCSAGSGVKRVVVVLSAFR